MSLAAIDWLVLALYALAVIAIGFAVSRRSTSGEELFLAGRSLGFVTIGFSLFASNISSTTLIGLAGEAYQSGISVAHYEIMAAAILVVMALVTIPVFLRLRLTTIPEYLERRFGPGTRRYVSAMTIFLSIFVDTAGSVYAGVLVLQTFAPGVPFLPACLGFALFAGAYTATGGLRAVVYTDVLQAIVLLVGSAAITWSVMGAFDYSWSAAVASIEPHRLSLIRPADDPALPWTGVLLGLPVLGFYYWSTNQYVMQRVLGARSLDHARWGALFAAALKLLPLFIMVLPGAFAVSLIADLDRADQVFPTLVAQFLPAGLTGLVLAGLVAAIMSTIDSTLNSASTLVIHDFAEAERKGWSAEKTLRYGRLATAVFVVIAGVWPLVIRDFPGLFSYIQQVFGYAVPPIVAVFLLGLLWKDMTARAALATLVVGHGLGLGIFAFRTLAPQLGIADPLPHFTVVAGLTTVVCMGIAGLVSLIDAGRPAAGTPDAHWHPRDALQRRPTHVLSDHRLQAAAVLAAAGLIVWTFR